MSVEEKNEDNDTLKGQEISNDSTKKQKEKKKPRWTGDRHVAWRFAQKKAGEKKTEDNRDAEKRQEVNMVIEGDPTSYKDVISRQDSKKWMEAMQEDINAMENNQVWDIVVKPIDVKPLHTKWVFKTKADANGDLERYKTRLLACGNEQRFGVYYEFTFAAVLEMTTVKFILGLARKWNVNAMHGDIPNAYAKALEDENEIYLYVPSRMEINQEKLSELQVEHARKVVLKLKKTLYGLKQAGRQWNRLLHGKLMEYGYNQSFTDVCIYLKRVNEATVVVGVYVDDLLVTGTNVECVQKIFKDMKELENKNSGRCQNF